MRLTALAGLVLLSACSQAADERPNVLLIVTDDMGYTDLGAFGGDDIATPNLDHLAMQGLRLTSFHVAPSCAPTRAMLMSGTGNHEAGLGTQISYPEFEGQEFYERYLPARIAALPEVLQQAGYHTYMAGKWHLGRGDETDGTVPGRRGFEQSFALLQGGDGHVHTVFEDPVEYSENGTRLKTPPSDFYSTTLFADKLIEQIDSASDSKPFFALFAPTAPHWPLQAPPGWLDRYRGSYDAGFDELCLRRMQGALEAGVLPVNADTSACPKEEVPWEELGDERRETYLRVMEIYAAMAEHLDLQIGRLVTHLEESGKLDNTWVLFLNDNGPQGGGFNTRFQGRLTAETRDNSLENLGLAWSWANIGQGWADAISAPFRDGKASQFEGGIRVPAFAWHADANRAGDTEGQLLTVMDIMPTILELTGTPVPGDNFANRTVLPMRGKSFAAVLQGETSVVHTPEEAIALDSAGRGVVMKGDWKIVREIRGDWMLFNILEDPGEGTDLASMNPQKLAELVADFERQAKASNYIRRVLDSEGP